MVENHTFETVQLLNSPIHLIQITCSLIHSFNQMSDLYIDWIKAKLMVVGLTYLQIVVMIII